MRNVLFAAVAASALLSTHAFAGNEAIWEGQSLAVVGAPTLSETNVAAEYTPGPTMSVATSNVALNDVGNERPAGFDGVPAGAALPQLAAR